MTAPGAEGEAREATGCPGRPVQSQRGETQGAAETQGGGEGEEEERGRGGCQVSVRKHSSTLGQIKRDTSLSSLPVTSPSPRQAKLDEERRQREKEEEEARQRRLLEEQKVRQREEEEREAQARLRAAQEKAQEEERRRRQEEEERKREEEEKERKKKEEQDRGGHQEARQISKVVVYRALYSFQARNADELSIDADCLIEVNTS